MVSGEEAVLQGLSQNEQDHTHLSFSHLALANSLIFYIQQGKRIQKDGDQKIGIVPILSNIHLGHLSVHIFISPTRVVIRGLDF